MDEQEKAREKICEAISQKINELDPDDVEGQVYWNKFLKFTEKLDLRQI